MDKFGFKIINIIINCIEIGVSFSFYFSVRDEVIFVIEVFLVSCCLSSTFTTMAPLFNKVFGKDIALEIYGLSIIFCSISDIPIVLLNEYMIKETKNYLIIYSIGGAISLMKLIALIFFRENKLYKYKNNEKENNNNNMEKIMI